MRQHQVLLVRHANLVQRVGLGQIGQGEHFLGADIAGDATWWLQRDDRADVATLFVRVGIGAYPAGERVVVGPRTQEAVTQPGQRLEGRLHEAGTDTLDDGRLQVLVIRRQAGELVLDHFNETAGLKLAHQYLDARLVQVVAPAQGVVNPQDGFDITQQFALG
ncbi:hypothetical protein D3C79_774030 [compost metagenome]